MKVFQNLTVKGSPDNLSAFLGDLVSGLLVSGSKDWRINTQVQERIERTVAATQSRRIAIETPVDGRLQSATLFMFVNMDGDHAAVGNIVPDANALSVEEYNSILRAFNEQCLQLRAVRFHVDVFLSADEYLLQNTLSSHNMKLLEEFARMANKNTGSHHPYDYKRWISFIASSVRDGQILNSGLLRQWLMEQDFPGDVAADLCQEYQFSVDLSERMEKATLEPDKVSAAH